MAWLALGNGGQSQPKKRLSVLAFFLRLAVFRLPQRQLRVEARVAAVAIGTTRQPTGRFVDDCWDYSTTGSSLALHKVCVLNGRVERVRRRAKPNVS